MYATAQKELAPEEDQGILFNLVKTPPATNIDYLEQVTDHLYNVFKTVPEKEHVFAINGMGGDVHQAFSGILFKPWEERNRTQAQILQDLQPKVNGIAGGQIITFGNPSLPGSTGGPPIQFVITTTADYEQLAQVLEKMQREAQKSGLFIFSDGDLKFDTPQVEVKIDHAKANSLGVTMQDIGASLATLLGGNYVNRFNLYGRSYQVIPQVPRDFRLAPDWIKRYEIKTSSGSMVPLSTVVDIRESVQPNALTSFQQLNSATLQGVPFPGRTVGEVIDFLKAKSKEIFPETFTYDFQGESRQYEQEGNRLVVTFIFALIIIYLVLAAQYESFRDPLIILIALPTSIFGALLPLTFGLGTVNIYTQIGLVTLIGLISKHGILMVDYANHLQAIEGLGAPRSDRGSRRRASAADPDDHGGHGHRHGSADHLDGRRRRLALRHRHRHRLRHDHRHAVHAVRDAGGLHLHRARASPRRRGRRAGTGQSTESPGRVIAAAKREDAALRRKQERQNKDEGLDQHDARSRRTVDVEADERADHARAYGDRGGNDQHALEAVAQQIGDCARRHEHGDDEDDANRLQGGDDGEGEQHQEPVVDEPERQSDRARVLRIEAVEQEVAASRKNDQQRSPGDDADLDKVARS